VQGSALGYGIDFGLLYQPPSFGNVTVALMARDLINTLYWNSDSPDTPTRGRYSEGVPRTLVLGAAYTPTDRSLLTLDIQPAVYGEAYTRFASGGDLRLLKVVALRGGFSQNFGTTWINRDVTLGLGIDYPVRDGVFRAGIAYIFDELVNMPRVGMAFLW